LGVLQLSYGFQKDLIMGQITIAKNATQFKAAHWTTAGKSEIWATVMVDGSDAGSPCAFGPREKMEAYTVQLNESKGDLSGQ
jgi:hypothetical protein